MGDFDMEAAVQSVGEGLGLDQPEEIVDDLPIEEPVAEVVARAAPQSWGKDTHEVWAKLDAKAQDQIERREKQYLEGLGQYREHNDFGKKMREIFTPYREILEGQGVDEAKAAQYLLAAHSKLLTLPPEQKLAYLSQIAGNYGINLTGQPQDPRLSAVEQTLHSIVAAQTQQQEREFKAHQAKVTNDVATFADAKDEKGTPLRPYFDEVSDDIVKMIRQGEDLSTAYDKAVWANPVTRAKEVARLKKETENSLRGKSKQETTDARRASGPNVRSRDTTRTPTEPLGKMEDTMKETLAEIRTRTH